MEPVIAPSGTSGFGIEANFLAAPALRQLRSSFAAESVNPWLLWLVASEGLAAWIRYLDQDLGEHLRDRHRAREILTAACAEMLRRRISSLPPSVAQRLEGADSADIRAFFEALSPGIVARSIRWSFEGLSKDSPPMAATLRAWRLLQNMDGKSRWLEVSHYLGELAIVLSQMLPKQNVPRAIGWLGDVCHHFGKEVAELAASLFRMPTTMESAIEILRMGEFLFRVNPEHSSGMDQTKGTGFIEGTACLWYTRPGWQQVHCGILGQFQAGISEVFGQSYSLTQTIPKHGGDTCRITMTPVQLRTKAAPVKPEREDKPTTWQPPTTLKGHGTHAERLASLAREKTPAEGFFGPETLLWEGTRESVILLGGGRAALMQMAHPAVAHAIRDHSVVHQDMLGRFMRTMTQAYNILFGSLDEARGISERVHQIHRAISGDLDDVPGQPIGHYHALAPEAIFWVGATLFDTTMYVFEHMVRPLSIEDKDRLVREAGAFWVLFGVPLETCPKTWRELRGYVVQRCESLAPLVGDTARQQAALLFAPHPSITQPIFDQLRIITAHMLPPPLRRAFKMELNPQERMFARSWIFAAERLTPRLPAAIRFVPAYHQAQWRLWQAKHGMRET